MISVPEVCHSAYATQRNVRFEASALKTHSFCIALERFVLPGVDAGGVPDGQFFGFPSGNLLFLYHWSGIATLQNMLVEVCILAATCWNHWRTAEERASIPTMAGDVVRATASSVFALETRGYPLDSQTSLLGNV